MRFAGQKPCEYAEEAWRGIFAAHKASKQTAASFCRKHGLRISQFYEWRRKLEARSAEKIEEVQRLANESHIRRKRARRKNADPPEFAAVQIIDQQRQAPPKSSGSLEVELAGGAKVRLTSDASLVLFESVVRILESR
jgi:transposase-like protein